jgi:hypothetical protein
MKVIYDIYVFIKIHIPKKEGWSEEISGTTVNAACQENLFVCHLGQACHRFVSPVLGRSRTGLHASNSGDSPLR